jgi:hypothetical protein
VNKPEPTTWEGCYGESWKGLISESAFCHPAKFSRGLIRRIYEHAIEEKWIAAGGRVLDPFGGVALGAADALRHGLHWTGIELELHFCDLGGGFDCAGFSKLDWRRFYGRAGRLNYTRNFRWCPDCITKLNLANAADATKRARAAWLRDLPPAASQGNLFAEHSRPIPSQAAHHFVGNLDLFRAKGFPGTARLLCGDSRRLWSVLVEAEADMVVSSPPYGSSDQNYERGWQYVDNPPERIGKQISASYGSTPGNLGNLSANERSFDAVIASPPFADANQTDSRGLNHPRTLGKVGQDKAWGKPTPYEHGDAAGNLSNLPADAATFEIAVGSPPFADARQNTTASKKGDSAPTAHDPEAWGMVVASPPYAQDAEPHGDLRPNNTPAQQRQPRARMKESDSPGQLAAMKEGELDAALDIYVCECGWQGASKEKVCPACGGAGSVVRTATLIVGSPPFADALNSKEGRGGIHPAHDTKGRTYQDYGKSDGQLGQMREGDVDLILGSPPYAGNKKSDYNLSDDGKTRRRDVENPHRQGHGCFRGSETYGQSDGQLGNIGNMAGDFDAIVSSPPFESVEGAHSSRKFKDPEGSAERRAEGYRTGRLKGHFASKEAILRSMNKANDQVYGDADGNLGNMKGGFDAVVSSPPYETSRVQEYEPKVFIGDGEMPPEEKHGYGENGLGRSRAAAVGDNFWAAAKQIVSECHAILLPGAHAIWVLKSYVRAGKIVDFPDQWRRLCESVGFRTVHVHRAMLVKEHGEQRRLDGDVDAIETRRVSFFRRLYEAKNPENRIEWEIVLCVQKGE